jgi:xylulokinase
LQLQADILGTEVIKSETNEAAVLGAALLAGIGVGLYANFDEACQAKVRYSDQAYQPRAGITEHFCLQAEKYIKLYHCLVPLLGDLGKKNLIYAIRPGDNRLFARQVEFSRPE